MYIDSSTNYNISVNSNAEALRLREILSNSTNELSQSMQRMSSGLRINSAKDDAAGAVISTKMLIELQGNRICQNNIQSANAMLSTTSDTLDAVLDNVSRIRELTLQTKNGTFSDSEVQAMQEEAEQLIAEIDRLSESSKYSQLDLFGKELSQNGVSFQVAANYDEESTITIEGNSGVFDSLKFDDIVKYTAKVVSDAVVNALGEEQEVENSNKTEFTADDNGKIYYIATNDSKEGYYKISENGENYEAQALYQYKGEAKSEDALNNVKNAKVGDIYTVGDKVYEYKWISDEENGAFGWEEADSTVAEKVVPENAEIKPYDENSEDKKFNLVEMRNRDKAFETALNALDGAIDDIASRKSVIGSVQSRLASAFDTLSTQYANLSSAKSIITDADIATEASNYTQSQILQQVSTSLLAQANQAPAIALSLI